MDREKFVGVVISLTMEGKEPVDYVLSSFRGEGNESIVFGIAPVSDPGAEKSVLKFRKPDVKFEMTVLHHSFRIAEKLYPAHPLLMAPEERMRRLTDEMLGRIESAGSLFRLNVFHDMLVSTIELLASQFYERFEAGTLPPDWIREIDRAIAPLIDDNLLAKIESLLDAEAIEEDVRPFFEKVIEELPAAIEATKQEGIFYPLAGNRLFKLLGLHLEGFINWEELLTITDSERFRPALTPEEVTVFSDAVSILHFRASGKKKTLKKTSKNDLDSASGEYKELYKSAIASARYMDAVSTKYHPHLPHMSAFAKAWHARTLLLEGKQTEAVARFEDILRLPITDHSRLERHDALMDLADLLSKSMPKRAQEYAKEAAEIYRWWDNLTAEEKILVRRI